MHDSYGETSCNRCLAELHSSKILNVVLESLEGVFNLDYPGLEVVIVDNGSTDGSFEAVKRFVEEKKPSDVRVKVLREL